MNTDENIVGVNIHYPQSHGDERGDLCEAWVPAWALHPDPVATVVFLTIRPGQARGWVMHHRQDDRVFVGSGSAKIALYDARENSATYGRVNEIFLGSERRGVLTIPAGVYHAFENIGAADVVFIDMPNRLYDRENPDTARLPLNSPDIPYHWRGKTE